MTLYATKDDDPSYYLLLVGMFTSTYTMTLVLFPFYYTTSEESHNIQLLAEVEKCKTHLQSVIDACYFIPFALGLTFLYGGLPCEQQLVFGTTAMFVVFHLIYTCLPVFLVLLAVIFFPVTYWYFRKLGLEAEAEEKLAKQKASDDLINEFPIFKFQTKTEDDDIEMVEKSQFLSQRKSEKQPMLEPSPAPTFVNDKVTADTPCLELDADDASCTVCLGQYEDGVHLRQLGCKHHFHKDCIDEWLRLNGKCPLCIQGLEEIPYEE
ncbi:hypothetical protein BC833DRAFT_607403 [Globomyces pollinis-pini]|nr:hypothetical protein BC833DRAFT_607403 [Globomyces pollinis-pini]